MLAAFSAAAAPVPSFTHLPHHLKINKCDPFSKEAVLFLHKQGIPAVRIIYGWNTPQGQGFHAALLFKHEGELYAMDNEHRQPVKLRKNTKTDWGAATQLSGGFTFYAHIWMTDEGCRRIKPKNLPDLFKPNPEWLEQFNISKQ
jgi:hypothetical protein